MPTEGQQSPPRHLGSSCRTRRADGVLSLQIRSTTAGREVMDSVFTASMLGAYSQSKLMDSDSKMSNCWCEDGDNIITAIVFLLLTFTLTQNQKLHSMFMYICMLITVFMSCNLCSMKEFMNFHSYEDWLNFNFHLRLYNTAPHWNKLISDCTFISLYETITSTSIL